MKFETKQQALQFQTVPAILGFAEGFAEGFARGFAEASVERAVEGAVEEGTKAKTPTVFVSKDTVDTVDIEAIAVAVGYQVTIHLIHL